MDIVACIESLYYRLCGVRTKNLDKRLCSQSNKYIITKIGYFIFNYILWFNQNNRITSYILSSFFFSSWKETKRNQKEWKAEATEEKDFGKTTTGSIVVANKIMHIMWLYRMWYGSRTGEAEIFRFCCCKMATKKKNKSSHINEGWAADQRSVYIFREVKRTTSYSCFASVLVRRTNERMNEEWMNEWATATTTAKADIRLHIFGTKILSPQCYIIRVTEWYRSDRQTNKFFSKTRTEEKKYCRTKRVYIVQPINWI